MIINALCEYYDILVQRGCAVQAGFSRQKVKYRICLSADGVIEDILDLGIVQNGKVVYCEELFPLRTDKTCIDANIVEHRPKYIFGLNYEKDSYNVSDSTNKAKKSHEEFVNKNMAFLEGLSSPLIDAYRLFIQTWQPSNELENPHLLKIAKNYTTASFDFCLSGRPNDTLEKDPIILNKWNEYFNQTKSDCEKTAECPIYGKILPVARTHDKIKGVSGGQPSGCVFICYNNDSDESYGKKQAENSGVSIMAMKRYTEALNYLLRAENHHTYIGDMTIVYFAMSNQEKYDEFIQDIFEPIDEEVSSSEEVEKNLGETTKSVLIGSKSDFSYYDGLDENVRFYIFGITPNSSRIAVKFCYTNTFGRLRKNVESYHHDFAIGDKQKAPAFWKINAQLKSPNSKSNSPLDVTESLLKAMLSSTQFPQNILETVVRRIKVDNDSEKNHFVKMNDTRVGLLKACLNRKIKKEEDKITMALNENNKNTAYLCGRLFAVLEKVQQDASGGGLNRTIKDAYFSSAASTPSVLFTRLIKLSGHHLSKLSDGTRIFYNKLISNIISDLSEFPKTLSLDEQGLFIIGYYQQNKEFYKKNIITEE